MSAAVTPARRLLALLEEEPSLETRPRDEIDADLAVLGIDSAGPVRLALRLAAENAGPAAALLDTMIEDESAEADIAALESADIADVRSRLQPGTVAAVTAEAQRRAGQHSNVVGIARRRRGVVWAWTGSLVGMAACALIVVAVWWPPSELSEQLAPVQMSQVLPETAASSLERTSRQDGETASPPPAALGMSAPRAEPEASAAEPESDGSLATAVAALSNQTRAETGDLADTDGASPTVVAEAPPRPPPLPPERQPQTDDLAEIESGVASLSGNAGNGVAGNLPPEDFNADLQGPAGRSDGPVRGLRVQDAPPLPAPLPPPVPAERRAAVGLLAAEEPAVAGTEDLGAGGISGADSLPAEIAPSPDPVAGFARGSQESLADLSPPAVEPALWARPLTVTDILIVDPGFADLEADVMSPRERGTVSRDRMETGLPTALLSDRLAQARRLADGRNLVALLEIRSAGGVFDAMLVRRATGETAIADDPAHAPLTSWFADRADQFSLVALPPGP